MENVRLIYEQVEAARRHLVSGSVLDCRLALILLDNVAELLMDHALRVRFGFDDELCPKWEPARSQWLQGAHRPSYTQNERAAAEREFEPKTRILAFRLNKISRCERVILTVCHKIRCEAFHRGRLRDRILGQITILLYGTTVTLTTKLPIGAFVLPIPNATGPDAAFLQRFGLKDAMVLGTDAGRSQIAKVLMEGVALEAAAFAETLSEDLVERLDETVGGLHYLAGDSRTADIDRNLQYTQFWRDQGAKLMETGVSEPELEAGYTQWQSEGRARFTMHRIERWRRQAVGIAGCSEPSRALDHYWGIDKRLRPLEEDIGQAVFEYDEWINAQLH